MTPCLCSGICSSQKTSIAYIYSTDGYKLQKIVLKTFSDQNLYFRRKCRCAESTGMKVNDSLCNYSCKNVPSPTCGNGVFEGYSSVYKTGRHV